MVQQEQLRIPQSPEELEQMWLEIGEERFKTWAEQTIRTAGKEELKTLEELVIPKGLLEGGGAGNIQGVKYTDGVKGERGEEWMPGIRVIPTGKRIYE